MSLKLNRLVIIMLLVPLSLSLFSNHSYFVTLLLALQYNCIVLFFISRHIFHTLQTDALIGLILVYNIYNITSLQHLSSQVFYKSVFKCLDFNNNLRCCLVDVAFSRI